MKLSETKNDKSETFYYATSPTPIRAPLTDRPNSKNWKHIDDTDEAIIYSVPPENDSLSLGNYY